MDELRTANKDQATLWNDAGGRTWVELQGVLDGLLAPMGARVVEEGSPGPGGRVLDVGCGAGATTLAMAQRLGPSGRCLGVDISGPLIEAARARAAAEGVAAEFVHADAQTFAFEPGAFDAVISRFGVMFFDDPVAAFANIRRAVRAEGRLRFVAWRGPEENPFMTTAGRAAAPWLPSLPSPPPGAPGQFAFGDAARVRSILESGGWSQVEVTPADFECAISARDLDTYAVRMGPVGIALRDADEATRERVSAAVREAFQPFVRDGQARFTAACWVVSARA